MIAVRNKPKAVRVAIYTRKSVSEGLDQEFNALEAQREAVEAFIRSQRGEGWIVLPERYDDGGYTGANTDRPAFQRLLADVKAGKIDLVATYKIDRLSRSLVDFTQLVELLRRHNVGLVSITQSFDSSTPMGRMVVNLLATFAEFERETIAERVRDKVQASRRRGMWTGGHLPLGFDVIDRKLVVNEPEAERVRQIFALYRTLGSCLAVAHELNARAWRTKSWKKKNGKVEPGRPFSKNSVHVLLRNPLYAGLIRSGDDIVPGQHEAIVDRGAWEETQRLLAEKQTTPRGWRPPTRNDAILRGLVRCSCGAAMVHHAAHRGSRRWSYYVCSRALKQGAAACRGSRAPAGKLEAFVVERLRHVGRDPQLLKATVEADREQRETGRTALENELRRLAGERKRLEVERRHVVKAIGRGAEGLDERVAELDAAIADVETAAQDAKRDLRSLDAGDIDIEELRSTLARFEPIWAQLTTAERSRALGLLLERVTFDAESGEVEIKFRAGASQALAGVTTG